MTEPQSQDSHQKNLQHVSGMISQETCGASERSLGGGDEISNFLNDDDLKDRFAFFPTQAGSDSGTDPKARAQNLGPNQEPIL